MTARLPLEQPARVYAGLQKRLGGKTLRRRVIRYSLLALNVALLAAVVWFVVRSPQNNAHVQNAALTASSSSNDSATDPLDQLSSADIAVNIARTANLPEATAVTNQADSQKAESAIVQSSSNLVAKPQVVATAFKSNKDIQTYIAKAGDTVSSIAAKFHVTSNSVRWSNGLSGDAVVAGTKLYIPPVNGIVYTVKSGDTPDSLAQKFTASKAQIIAYNDAEITGLRPGEVIIIPNGQQPASASPTYYGGYGSGGGVIGSLAATYGGFGSCVYGGKVYSNYGYDCGYCTWWVAMRRAVNGEPVPSNMGDAYTWKYNASAMGMSEGNVPRPGAIMWFTDNHVGYVESVSGGTVTISEMNHFGWGIENSRSFSASEASGYTYIY